ncbi:MAG TPA: tripartite tricarboxylate transporter TctB family protein [Candidatus Binatia bacterium]|nr:tripartite tricarboxylate transporter TctB family protein [Candidatus Binatia bacterium]
MARYLTLEAFLLAVLAGFSGLFLLATKDYGTTAALFPRVIALAALAFLVVDLVWGYVLAGKECGEPQAKTRAVTSSTGWVWPLALQGGYIALIYVAGLSTATLFYLVACPWQLRYRNWVITILHAVLLTLVIVYTFHYVFHVRLPKGLLGIPF